MFIEQGQVVLGFGAATPGSQVQPAGCLRRVGHCAAPLLQHTAIVAHASHIVSLCRTGKPVQGPPGVRFHPLPAFIQQPKAVHGLGVPLVCQLAPNIMGFGIVAAGIGRSSLLPGRKHISSCRSFCGFGLFFCRLLGFPSGFFSLGGLGAGRTSCTFALCLGF